MTKSKMIIVNSTSRADANLGDVEKAVVKFTLRFVDLLYLKETMAVTRVKTVVILTLSFALNHYRINPVHAKTVISIMLQAQLDQIGQKRPKRFLMTQLITRFLKTASILQLTRIYIYISNLYNLYKLLK